MSYEMETAGNGLIHGLILSTPMARFNAPLETSENGTLALKGLIQSVPMFSCISMLASILFHLLQNTGNHLNKWGH